MPNEDISGPRGTLACQDPGEATGDAQVASAPPRPLPRYPVLGRIRDERRHVAPTRRVPCLLDGATARYTVNARMATAQALRLCGVQAGDEVLLPAYHCPTMVHPVRWIGAVPRFYRLHEDLTIDTADLASRITQRTRAVVAVHYFGFPTPLRELDSLCRDRGLALIEDCAHALLGGSREQPFGQSGDYAVGSLMKFLPIFDGGCITSHKHPLDDIALRGAGPSHELRAMVRPLQLALHFRHAGPADPRRQNARPGDRNSAAGTPAPGPAGRGEPAAADGEFDPYWVDRRMSLWSRWLCARADWSAQARRRRENHRVLGDTLGDAPGISPWRRKLPDGIVPYVFAVQLAQPDPVFKQLQALGVPVMRWDDLAADPLTGACETSRQFGRNLIQIPCHQSLSVAEMSDVGRLIVQLARQARRRVTTTRAPDPAGSCP